MMLVVVLAVTTAVVPLNLTVLLAGVALKFNPVIMTVAPSTPLVGLNDVMVGPTVKLVTLVAVFPATVTLIVPVVAPEGTVVVMLVAVLAVTTAVVPLNLTVLLAGVVLKFVPGMLTVVPTAPLVGVKLEIVGKDEAEALFAYQFSSLSMSERTIISIVPSPFISADLIRIGPSAVSGKS